MNNYEDLKIALTDTGNPFVWITDEGWAFNEQKESTKYEAEKVLSVDSFEQLFALKNEQDKKPVINKPKNK